VLMKTGLLTLVAWVNFMVSLERNDLELGGT
jgi:hypothetical protein